jgi:hypothetical protein
MKILAVIPKTSGSNVRKYIAEVEVGEVANLTLLSSTYKTLPITCLNGFETERKIDELEVGDETSAELAREAREAFARYVNARHEIEKAMANLRGSMTKLQNLTTPSEIPT